MSDTPKRTVGWERITPDTASNWLAGNVNEANRHIRKKKVEQYARDMEEGRWTQSNDAISFDQDGKLLNGQHRLSAIVKHGKAVEMLVARGLPREAQVSMDSGATRQLRDHLQMSQGKANATALSAVSRQMVLIEQGIHGNNTVSRQEQLQWLDEHPEIEASIEFCNHMRKKMDSNPTAMAIAHWMISQVNSPDLANLYFTKLAVPAGEEEGSAIFAVLNRLRTSRDQRTRVRSHLSLLLRGWNRWAKGQTARTLPMASNDMSVPKIARWERGEI